MISQFRKGKKQSLHWGSVRTAFCSVLAILQIGSSTESRAIDFQILEGFFPKMHRFFNGAEIGDPPKNDNSYVDPLTKKHIFTNVMSQKNLKIKPKQPGWFLSLILSKLFKQKIHLPVLALQTSIWGLSLCQPSLFDHKVFPYPKNVSSQEHLEAKSKNLQWPRRFPHIESGWPGPWGREWGEISIWSTLLGVEVLRFF